MNADDGSMAAAPAPRARVLGTIRLGLTLIFIVCVGVGSCICVLYH